MGSPAVTITPDTAPQQSGAPVTITPDAPRGFLANAWNDIKSIPSALTAPDPIADPRVSDADKWKLYEQQSAAAQNKADQRTKERGLPYSLGATANEMLGVNVEGEEQAAKAGDPGGVLGHAAVVPAMMAAGEAVRAMPAKGQIARSMGAAAKPLGVFAEDLPVVGSVIKGAKALGNVRGAIADIWNKKPVYPGAPEPAAPPAELSQASALFRGAKPGEDPSAGLGQIPVRGKIAESMANPAPASPPFKRGELGKMLDEQLSKATNAAPPLNPKEPIYKRGSIAQQVKSAPSEDLTPVLQKSLDQVNAAKDIPEGHTPLTSSAMKSYKYDPAAREFHARMTSGDTTYVYGDVSPEDAQAFEAAESKGKALPQIKRNPLVAKIVNGKRVAVKPGVAQ